MRRIPIIVLLLAALLAASVGASQAHAAKAKGRGLSATASRSSHKTRHRSQNQQKPSAHAVQRTQSKIRNTAGRVRTAVLRRHSHAPAPTERPAEPTPQPAAVVEASLQTRRTPLPSPLRGNYDSLLRQNTRTEADGLERIEDDDDLADRINRGMLVPVPVTAALTINGNLPPNRRYCRPWTASFLTDTARAHAALFHSPLEVSSAVRTVAYQKQLMKTNGNATAAEGDVASPHLTGATIDIAKQGLSRQEIGWMRAWLLKLQVAGKIDVEEEFQQSCFHITVYKSYAESAPARKTAAQTAVNLVKASGNGL
jgi:hypothetical protein